MKKRRQQSKERVGRRKVPVGTGNDDLAIFKLGGQWKI